MLESREDIRIIGTFPTLLTLCNHICSHFENGMPLILLLSLFFAPSTNPVQDSFVAMMLKCAFVLKRVKYVRLKKMLLVFLIFCRSHSFTLITSHRNTLVNYGQDLLFIKEQ